MAQFIFPNKEVYEIDNPTEQELAWAKAQGGLERQSQAADVVKAATSGLGEGAVRAPFLGGDLFGLGATLLEKLRPGSTSAQNRRSMSQEFIDTAEIPLYKPQTTAGRYANTMGNAVGGGLALPVGASMNIAKGAANTVKNVMGTGVNIGRASGVGPAITSTIARGVQTPLLQNAAIGAGSQLGAEVSSQGGKYAENPLMSLGGGAAAALTLALAARGATPKFAASTSRALEDMKPADWQKAAHVQEDMTRAGSTQFTIADLLPETSRLRPVVQEMSNAPGGGQVYDKLAGRENGEIARLLEEAKTGAQQTAVPNVSPLPGLAGADDFLYDVARSNRTGEMMPHLANAPRLPKEKLNEIVQALQKRAGLESNAGTVDADFSNRAAATIREAPIFGANVGNTPPSKFTMPGQQSVTDVPVVNGAVLPEGISSGSGSFVPGGAPPVTDIAADRGANVQALSKIVKSLMDRDATVDATTGKMLQNSAAVSSGNAASRELASRSPGYAAAMDAYKAKSPQVDIAEILAKQKLSAVPSRANADLASLNNREELTALLAKLDPTQAETFSNKLAAADRLSMLKPQQGAEGAQQELRQTMLGGVVQPFGTVSRKAGLSSQLDANQQLSRLIANPTAENRAILAELGRNNPDLARKIREISNLGAVNSAAQKEQ